MISVSDFAKMVADGYEIIQMQAKDLTQVDTLIQPQPGGNCMNWVLGHVLDSYINILDIIGGDRDTEVPDLSRYQRNSELIRGEGAGVLPLELLLENLEMVSRALSERLSMMTEADFDDEIELWGHKARRGWWTFFFYFHNTYHIGQLEYLRNLAGKVEKVI